MPDATPSPQPDKVTIPDPSIPYLTLREAAAFARCHKRTIRRWLTAGHLTRHGHGRSPLVYRAELAAFLSPTPSEDAPSAVATAAETDA